ncbi:MAG: hypothetical protein ACRDYZ_03700 [Acidimicrobiales bacterium]
MIPGLIGSLVILAVGAILDFAVTVSPYQHGFNIRTVGLILMIVGGVGVLLSILAFASGSGGWRKHRTVVDDGRGNVVRRDDTYR